ncbi:hypothetical protein WAI453_013120 [Rhynchosporium graminicola]
MAPHQIRPNTRKAGRQPSLQRDQRKRPQGIKKERPQLSSRKSARLERTISKDRNIEPKHHLSSPTSNTSVKEVPMQRATNLTQASGWKTLKGRAKKVWNDIEKVHKLAITDDLNGILVGLSSLKGQYVEALSYRKIVDRRKHDYLKRSLPTSYCPIHTGEINLSSHEEFL